MSFDDSFVYLSIKLTPEASKKFRIDSWLAIPKAIDDYQYEHLRQTFEQDKTYTQVEIEEKFSNLITECNEKTKEIQEKLGKIEQHEEPEIAVEWILPTDLLSLDIDCWKYRENSRRSIAIACGNFRSYHVRSSQRLDIRYNHCRRLWKQKWKQLMNNLDKLNLSNYLLAYQYNIQNEEDLIIVNQEKNILGINFPTDLQTLDNLYESIIETGILLALWSRCKQDEVNHVTDLDSLINPNQEQILNLQTLPYSIQTKRLQARASNQSDPNHLGYHLCFLWENPYNYVKTNSKFALEDQKL